MITVSPGRYSTNSLRFSNPTAGDDVRQVLVIFNSKTFIITVLAVVSTYVCINLGITADFPMTLIATAVVFPIVFSINGAYKRRESALDQYSSIKAHGRGIYFASRDWLENTEAHLPVSHAADLAWLQ